MAGPPVAFLHGFGTSYEQTWVHNGWVDLLRDVGRDSIGIDLLGHGSAPKPHDPAAYAELEERVLDDLPPEPVDAVGFSLGARTLLWLAGTYPDRFRRVIVAGVGANLFQFDPERGRAIVQGVAGDADAENPESLYFSSFADAPGADRAALLACITSPRKPITVELLAKVVQPTLVVLGDRDFAGPADPLMDALPNARLKMLRHVDHHATPKDFGFLDAALAFLDG
ncbi:MAG: alpha/beta fold hydrolase [Actinobacteria bacterium]|nr:MAG: alpha/beta fold hydrolase [Actinomycetota bacterium]